MKQKNVEFIRKHSEDGLIDLIKATAPITESHAEQLLKDDVKEAEKKIKLYFKNKISSAEAGLSEWISDINVNEILAFIEELKNEHFIKLEEAPAEFLPLTMNNCEDFLEWLSSNNELQL
mgnify:CR=1 FL=1